MIIHRLRVENFAGLVPGAEIGPLGPGITVVQGGNEEGKTTLFRALVAALYQRHGITGADAEARLRPVGRKVAPTVTVEFETRGERYRLTKRFLSAAKSELLRHERGEWRDLATGSEADETVRELLGAAFAGRGWTKEEHYGLGQILFAVQGRMPVETLGDGARDALTDAIGNVSQTREAHGFADALYDRYDRTFTPQGRLRTGANASPLVRLREEREQWEERLATACALIEEARRHEEYLAERTERRDEHERRRRAAEDALTAARRDQDAAREADVGLERLDVRIRDTGGELARLRAAAGEIEQLAEQAGAASADAAAVLEQRATAQVDLDDVRRRLAQVRERADAAASARETAAAAAAAARDARSLLDLSVRIVDRTRVLERDAELAAEQGAVSARLAEARRPADDELERLAAAQRAVERLERRVADRQLQFRLRADHDVTVTDDNGEKGLLAGDLFERHFSGSLRLHIAGAGGVEISGPSDDTDVADLTTQLDDARVALRDLRAPYGDHDLAALTVLARERRELEETARRIEALRAELFTDGVARTTCSTDLAADRSRVREIRARRPEWTDALPESAEVVALERAARSAVSDATDGFERAGTALQQALTDETAALERLGELDAAAARAEQHRQDREGRLAELRAAAGDAAEREARAAEVAEQLAALESARAEAQQARDALGEDPAEVVRTCDREIEQLRERSRQMDAEANRRRGQLDQILSSGPYRDRALAEERLAALASRLEVEELRTEALRRLREMFEDDRAGAVATVLRPVSQKLARLVPAVLRRPGEVRFGEDFLPLRFELGDVTAELGAEQLSFGTRDQLSVLVRLAYAEVIADETGERQLLVLDDPLVHVDDERRRAMLTILGHAAKDLQVVILTCHPEQYYGLPDAETVAMSAARARLRHAD